MVTTILPIFVVYILHEGVDKLGIVIAIATFVSYAFRIFFGYLSDKYQLVKPFVVTGYFISAITKPLLAFSTSFASVSLLRATDRMGKAIRSASKDTLLSSSVINGAHGRTFGFHKMMDIAGELSGALIIFFIFMFIAKDEAIIRDIFKLTLFPGIIATLIALFYIKDIPKVFKEEQAVIHKEDYKLLPILFIYFAFLFFIMSEQFFILKAKEDGYGLEIIPLFIILFTGIQTLVSYYSGVLNDKIGLSKTLLISFVFGMLSIALMQVNLWLAFISLGFFTVMSLNAMRSYISQKAISKSFIFGVLYGGVAIFSAIGAIVVGYIWKIYGFETVLIFSEVGMLITLLLLLYKRSVI
jgi:MFS family permease